MEPISCRRFVSASRFPMTSHVATDHHGLGQPFAFLVIICKIVTQWRKEAQQLKRRVLQLAALRHIRTIIISRNDIRLRQQL